MSDPSVWIGKLGQPKQYRGVPYVTTESGYTICHLCGTGEMSHGARKSHFLGMPHASMYEHVQNLEREEARKREIAEREEAWKREIVARYQQMESLKHRANSLGLETWRSTVKHAMFDYIDNPFDCMSSVTKLLEKYEQKERLSLLELAVWRARVADGVYFPHMDHVREYPALDENFDAKRYIRNARVCSGSEVIVPRVLAFL